MCDYLKRLVEVVSVIVDGKESPVTPAEGNLVASIVPPVGESSSLDLVAESDHIGDLSPPVFAHPSIAASAILEI